MKRMSLTDTVFYTKPSIRYCLSLFKFILSRIHRCPHQTLEHIMTTLGYLRQLDEKTLFLKTAHI